MLNDNALINGIQPSQGPRNNKPSLQTALSNVYKLSRQSSNITSAWRPSAILNVHNGTRQELTLQNNNGSGM